MNEQAYWTMVFILGIGFVSLTHDARQQNKSLLPGAMAYLLAFFILTVSQKIIMKHVASNVVVESVIMWTTIVLVAGVLLLGLSSYRSQKERQFHRKFYMLFCLGLLPTLVSIYLLSGLAALIPLGLFALVLGHYFFRHYAFDSETHRFILKQR